MRTKYCPAVLWFVSILWRPLSWFYSDGVEVVGFHVRPTPRHTVGLSLLKPISASTTAPVVPVSHPSKTTAHADGELALLHCQTISVHHILHPFIFDDEDDENLPAASLFTALRDMRKAVDTIAVMVNQQNQEDDTPSSLLRIEHTIAGCQDVLAWLRAQTRVDDDFSLMYFSTEHREVSGLGVTMRAPSGSSWPDVLPRNAVWYGGAQFDANNTIKDEDWSDFWTDQHPDAFWILPAIELVRQENDEVVLAVHCRLQKDNLAEIQRLLQQLTGHTAPRTAPPLPPILSRDESPVDVYEDAVATALTTLEDPDNELTKVVFARTQTLRFAQRFKALDVVARCKYFSSDDGMLFLLQPTASTAFLGSTPETLFRLHQQNVTTEALAGTRPRGASESDDQELLQDLLASPKDRRENRITADFVENVLETMSDTKGTQWTRTFGVRRLRHLQHICARYTMPIGDTNSTTWEIAHTLLQDLHPTPAVGGAPKNAAMNMIKEKEGIDRGMYAGPVGYIGRNATFLGVGIRSALYTDASEASSLKVFAGSGLVEGSTLLGEWAETNSKLAVMSSLFPQSPVSLRGSPTPNVAWARAFCEELVRNGVTQFYICPGSRSTPLTVTLAKMQVQCTSVHDERAAGFRAVGYARGTGRPAAVVTSSGTAVANLYPAIIEAGVDGLPMIILTADRPYENRDMGANQAIDQVKIFSASYVRWFRDVLPPSDDVPVSVALSDACQAVAISRENRGPVHLNLQFRENLSPDAGPIRNDNREGSLTQFDDKRFTDVAGFKRWSERGGPWMLPYHREDTSVDAISDLASLIEGSKRGMLVVGNLRKSVDGSNEDSSALLHVISDFAKAIGFPIVAGVQSAGLRYTSSAVIPFAEHILKNKRVSDNLRPDLVIQIGSPLVSTTIPHVISSSMKHAKDALHHVLIHPHAPTERADPESTVTHRISASFASVLPEIVELLSKRNSLGRCSSELTPLVWLGRRLAPEILDIVDAASRAVTKGSSTATLTEPELIVALSEMIQESSVARSLFLSNSMPIRDAESYFYPFVDVKERGARTILSVGSNRGASGIDGIISSAIGFSEATRSPTTLIIGDLSSLHDIGSLHSLSNERQKSNPLTTIIVNNDGGGIFSFLPVARHGENVGFEEFFGTPTGSFSFTKGAEAFGIDATSVSSKSEFVSRYSESMSAVGPSVLEATVVDRSRNVEVHRRVNDGIDDLIDEILGAGGVSHPTLQTVHIEESATSLEEDKRTLLLMHGWMGDTTEWSDTLEQLKVSLGPQWEILSVDLPGHGRSPRIQSSPIQSLRQSLELVTAAEGSPFTLELMADAVVSSLVDRGVSKVHAIAGYSAGGRIGLMMKRLCVERSHNIIDFETSLVLIGAYPGSVPGAATEVTLSHDDTGRKHKNRKVARELAALCNRSFLKHASAEKESMFDDFLYNWYDKPMWGDLKDHATFGDVIKRRASTLAHRGRDIISFLVDGSPSDDDAWELLRAETSLFLAGSLDTKYSAIGKSLFASQKVHYEEIPNCGHSLLVEAPEQVARLISNFVGGSSTEVIFQENPPTVIPERAKFAETVMPVVKLDKQPLWSQALDTSALVEVLSFVEYSIPLVDPNTRGSKAFGIGWGNQAGADSRAPEFRKGFILQLESKNGLYIGLGEASPLPGVHSESLADVRTQLVSIQKSLASFDPADVIEFDPRETLTMQGKTSDLLDSIGAQCGVPTMWPTVRSALEMAILSLSSHLTGLPLHQAMSQNDQPRRTSLALNGIVIRTPSSLDSIRPKDSRAFQSVKVKVGHQDLRQDEIAILRSYQMVDRYRGRIRADANRSWNESQAIEFATALEGLDVHAREKFEFVEEPLRKTIDENGAWNFAQQIVSLERSYFQTGIPYALDESLADLAKSVRWSYELMEKELVGTFGTSTRGCAAVVLKPSVLGIELSLRLAMLARSQLQIGAVFSSCFETGVGLAYISLLAHVSDQVPSRAQTFPHGVGTFTMLSEDTLIPAFETYVDQIGYLQVSSLSRSLYGLRLEDLKECHKSESVPPPRPGSEDYESATAASRSGKEISAVASIQLPFSPETACARFTDLPTISRWSPWVSNVEYQGSETEWTVDIRGISLKWRAKSQILNEPYPGIRWQSVSGLVNHGIVEFIEEKDSGCLMNVRMTLVPPRLLRPLFQGTSVFLEDFLRDKLLKWSLEMFRDVVKADLALERGEVELGDALIGSVEGKATAIKATLDLDLDD